MEGDEEEDATGMEEGVEESGVDICVDDKSGGSVEEGGPEEEESDVGDLDDRM